MSFLPDDYESPKTSNSYFRFQEGENRIRILSRPILGWEDWDNKKPIRFRMNDKPTKSIDPKKSIKHFWAFIIFNYNSEQIEIMQITQATIRKSIEALSRDTDWGAPYNYDIKIMKRGEGVDSEYAVNPVPHKPVDAYIVECFNDKPCNLEALFDGSDPFSNEWKNYTPLAVDAPSVFEVEEQEIFVHSDQRQELKKLFDECDPLYKKSLMFTLGKLLNPVTQIEQVPNNLFYKIFKAVAIKHAEYRSLIASEDILSAV